MLGIWKLVSVLTSSLNLFFFFEGLRAKIVTAKIEIPCQLRGLALAKAQNDQNTNLHIQKCLHPNNRSIIISGPWGENQRNILTQSQVPSWLPSSFKSAFEIILDSLSFLSMNIVLTPAFIIFHLDNPSSLLWIHFFSPSLLQTTPPPTLLFPFE